jgi:hypothetical protein
MALLAAASARAAFACSCMSSGPPCQAYFQSDAVFVGTVEAMTIRQTPLDGLPDRLVDRRVVHVAIERAARGVTGAAVDLWTGMGGGDCGFDFKVGERYVIYASRHPDGSLSTGICSRTRLLTAPEAAEDLAYLSAVPASGSGAHLSGSIKHRETDYASATGKAVEYGGVPDVQVIARGRAGVFSGMTDQLGRYDIGGLPVGSYELEVLPPAGYSTLALGGRFEIKDVRACQIADFALHSAGRVSGTIVDAAGQPAAGLHVEIAPDNRLDQPVRNWIAAQGSPTTDSLGHFELTDIPPGRFVVGVGLTLTMNQRVTYPRTLYPAIDASAGSVADLGTLTLPAPLKKYELHGTAVDAEGAPIAGASIVVFGPRFEQLTMDVRSAADGTFTVPVLEGLSIRVHGSINLSTNPFRQANGEERVTVSGPPAPIRLVLVVR